jgi:uncharacterized OB-fold protein
MTMTSPSAEQRAPIPAIRGTVCVDCGSRFYPLTAICLRCFGRNVSPVDLSPTGSVTAFSIVRRAAKGYNGPVPYVIGSVRLSDGVTVLGHLTQQSTEAWRVGEPVTLTACQWHEHVLAFAPSSAEVME